MKDPKQTSNSVFFPRQWSKGHSNPILVFHGVLSSIITEEWNKQSHQV